MKNIIQALAISAYCSFGGSIALAQSDPIFGDPLHPQPLQSSFNPLRYSDGYVLGIISRLESRGFFIRTLEGEIKLGRNSSSGGILNVRCFEEKMAGVANNDRGEFLRQRREAETSCSEAINPWAFSHLDHNLVDAIAGRQQATEHVVLLFRKYFFVPFVRSENYLLKVYLPNVSILNIGDSYRATHLTYTETFRYREGFFDGRIVRASRDGILLKANEIVIQLSNSGDSFRKISVANYELFSFMILSMMSGRYLRVHFIEMLSAGAAPANFLFGYDTNYRATRVEIVDEPTDNPGLPAPE